ncbi:MAG TPA: hypothetical protein VHP34_08690 [Alphaproteobacteria bacterium]|nr:hypothetical protein [Alphaproteobacteria bacterium]
MLHDVVVNPPSGRAENIIIFFHGYGSSGASMAQHVGNLLAPHLPDTKIYCPNGLIKIGEDRDGNTYHSWFPVEDMLDNPDNDKSAARVRMAMPDIQAYIDDVLKREGISEDRVIIAGFSQGASTAFYAGLLRDTPVAGVYSLSGGALDRLTDPQSKPPVALLAGAHENQGYSGHPMARATYDLLKDMGFKTDVVVLENQGHSITPESMRLLGQMTRYLTPDTPRPPAGAAIKAQQKQSLKPPRP